MKSYNNYPNYKIIVVDSLTYAGSVKNLPVPIWKENGKLNKRVCLACAKIRLAEMPSAVGN